jgi:hypothetical protein
MAPTATPGKPPSTEIPIMATTIADLPSSRALDYQAMSAIRGAGISGDWCLNAFRPFVPESDLIAPIVVYQTNYFADQLNVLTNNIDIKNSGAGATINVATLQNALNLVAADPAKPSP